VDHDLTSVLSEYDDFTARQDVTGSAIRYGREIIKILYKVYGADEDGRISYDVTGNATMEFYVRYDADNELIMESGTNGTSGLIVINGDTTYLTGVPEERLVTIIGKMKNINESN
jgi:hypothetical protein